MISLAGWREGSCGWMPGVVFKLYQPRFRKLSQDRQSPRDAQTDGGVEVPMLLPVSPG